jgi:hypothetical protein
MTLALRRWRNVTRLTIAGLAVAFSVGCRSVDAGSERALSQPLQTAIGSFLGPHCRARSVKTEATPIDSATSRQSTVDPTTQSPADGNAGSNSGGESNAVR